MRVVVRSWDGGTIGVVIVVAVAVAVGWGGVPTLTVYLRTSSRAISVRPGICAAKIGSVWLRFRAQAQHNVTQRQGVVRSTTDGRF